ncbi:MAG TPA: hypothetical protein VFO05_14790 [Candidatus Limnocylindrales bacterium]|nr:hypothetical protein [Candidatus Limnocylindrales bacterium]
MTMPTGSRIGSRWGVVAQIVAIAGILLCIAVILGIWLGRGAVQSGLDDVGTTVDRGFQRGIDAATAVSDRIDAATTQLETVAADARELAESQRPEATRLVALQQRLGQFADGYRALRIRYAEVRENVAEAMSSVQRIARIVPGAEVPEGPVEALAAVDARLQELDERITGIWPSAGEQPPVDDEASRVSEAAAAIREAVSGASTAVRGLSSGLESAQARANDGLGRIGVLVVIGATALSLVFAWVLLLNVALWWLGHLYRERGRQRVSPPPAEASPAG